MLSKDGEALSAGAIEMMDAITEGLQSGLGIASWFAVYVSSRHEKKVDAQLALRQIERFLPLYKSVHQWKNRCRRMLDLPLFPNYLFVHIAPIQRVAVLQVPGVLSIVRCGAEPSPIPCAVIHALRTALSARAVEPHPYLVIGHRVRITSGPLTGMTGILVNKKNNLRVVLAVEQIMQSAAVEVNGNEVEDIGPVRQQFKGDSLANVSAQA